MTSFEVECHPISNNLPWLHYQFPADSNSTDLTHFYKQLTRSLCRKPKLFISFLASTHPPHHHHHPTPPPPPPPAHYSHSSQIKLESSMISLCAILFIHDKAPSSSLSSRISVSTGDPSLVLAFPPSKHTDPRKGGMG